MASQADKMKDSALGVSSPPRRRRLRGLLVACSALLAVQVLSGGAVAQAAETAPRTPTAARVAEQGRPNVLLIISDDLNTRLGTYGGAALTPNIDRLASEGVRFDQAYSQFPWCAPSRASFLTGLRPSAVGVLDLHTPLRNKVADLVTLPEYFRQSGYFTARSGKIFHQEVPSGVGHAGPDDPQSWNVALNPAGRDLPLEPKMHNLTPGLGRGSTLGWLDGDGPDNAYTDGKVADDVIALLSRQKTGGQPFFIAAGFYRPHTPEISPKAYFERYPQASIATTPVKDATKPLDITSAWSPDDFGMNTEEQKAFIRAYYASTSYMDAQVGRILEALKARGLDRNTIVVFVSDHGFLLGEHHQWMKNVLWEQSTRVPLIIRAPGMAGNGGQSGKLVELVDLFPTLVDLAGLKPVAANQGSSMAGLLKDPGDKAWDKPAFSQIAGGRSVRSGPWRYTEWQAGKLGRELYNVEQDPQEARNLVDDPANAAVIARLSAMLPKDVEVRRKPLAYDPAADCLHMPPNLAKAVGTACQARLDP
ncbi:sulfatase [Caulobacter sp. RL271]|uniref:Sulfatase n=1 Tax=Caulobacter segnis TaxID=88688 RepID=A0ABY4ZZG7_9CAUL|nr:sulfatase [Caulobacter segnis]USQ98060.1 sulfatase [Caulobacter segnis]